MKVKDFIRSIKLWFISSQTAQCDCIWWEGFTLRWRPSTLVQINMSDVTVDSIETIECDACSCTFILSKFGVAKCSKKIVE